MDLIYKLVTKKRLVLAQAFLTIVALLATPHIAFAAYRLNKVRIFLSQRRSIDTIKVTNPGDKPTNVQAQIFAWTKKNGKDNLTASNEIIVSPPIMKIPPNRTQLLRVGWRRPTPLATEKAFRMFVQEITPEKPLEQTGVRIRLRLGVPIYILPTKPVYKLNWESQGLSGNNFKVKVTNVGNVHISVSRTELKTADGKVVGKYSENTNIFPKQSDVITFKMTETGTKNLNIVANTDHQIMRSTITLP